MKAISLLLLAVTVAAAVQSWLMFRMPGESFAGEPPPLLPEEIFLRDELARDVQVLAGEIGERNMQRYGELVRAAGFIERSFTDTGLRTQRQRYDVRGQTCENLVAEIPGTDADVVVIGAHYDSVTGSPGANDNGSGVAALLALARSFAGKHTAHTLRFVAFANEEPGHFQTEEMGSWVYAKRCRERGDRISAMVSLETIGYFSNAFGSQTYPVPGLGAIYPTTGNFIAFVGNVSSRRLVRQALGSFRAAATLPSEGAALPGNVPGVGWSDHWSFWQQGYPGIMITDTAPFRYPHYHARTDTAEKLNYVSMSRIVTGMKNVIADLAGVKR